MYKVQTENGQLVMLAGAVHGITEGAEFSIYGHHSIAPSTQSLGTMRVTSTRAVTSFVEVTSINLPKEAPFLGALIGNATEALFSSVAISNSMDVKAQLALGVPAYALQTKAGKQEDLSVRVEPNQGLGSVLDVLLTEMQTTDTSRDTILWRDKFAKLDIALKNGRVVFTVVDHSAHQHGSSRIPHTVRPVAEEIKPVVRAAAHYFSHLHRTSTESGKLSAQIQVEIMKLDTSDPYDVRNIRPIGPNLNRDGVVDLVADSYARYGIQITNKTKSLGLYPSIYLFQGSDLSISEFSISLL